MMRPTQQIFRVRREYNIWVGNQTLEDYALRFTAKKARQWSIGQVAMTALGATAFMALEAIAASVTLSYGFTNFVAAMLTVAAVIFITGLPITYYAARHGLDIDLLTRGAGFGYLGSTLTSLIYASFTFIFFAIEAAILASALQALLGVPLWAGYVLCALAVIPVVTHGITAISRFQIGTQLFWLTLQILALVLVAWHEIGNVKDWSSYAPPSLPGGNTLNIASFGASASILFSMMAQIGEQVDYLRFMPQKTPQNSRRWWAWLVLAGPGWIFIGMIKMLLGSYLAWLAITSGASVEQAGDPTRMYQKVFLYLTNSPTFALLLAATMVIVSQMKINVTNAYAGSIAWSNFFSRLTHSHPGRVVWLVFNVTIALLLMELGIYRVLEAILGVFAIVAVSWLGCLSADLMINKPLGLSPPLVEFKRAHLYDINPVGTVSMVLASTVGILSYLGSFGDTAHHLAHFISLGICFVSVPLVAWLSGGRFYLARQSPELLVLKQADADKWGQSPIIGTDSAASEATRDNRALTPFICCICENTFEQEDVAHCPAYQGPICSLCCSLDSRCMDSCKPNARFPEQLKALLQPLLPSGVMQLVNTRLIQFLAIMTTSNLLIALLLWLIYFRMQSLGSADLTLVRETLYAVFFIFLIVSGVIAWLFLLAHESRVVAQQESSRQTLRLMDEIEAHKLTDRQLQLAKEQAERANSAKSRYLTGISHELRTPLQTILGYAQLLVRRQDMPPQHTRALQTIKRSGEYLADLIEGLLDISKIEAGRLDIYRNRVNLPELIQQLELMFLEPAQQKGIGLSCHIHSKLPDHVITDEKRLRQILINLLSNAIKYTQQGRVEFHVRYRNQVAEFSVVDTGVGIHEKDMQRILAPFERVRSPDVPNVPGTGLGLTIVKLLTDIMGGELRIRSTPGLGSTFTVNLMFSRSPDPVEAAHPSRLIAGYKGARKVILVVDDEPIHRGLMADLLNPLGFLTLEAQDADSCLALLEEARPDLFLLDVNMPGRDGHSLAAQLRERGWQRPIIMVSADAQQPLQRADGKRVFDDYLVKPINNQKLLDRIGNLLGLEWIYADERSEVIAPKPATPAKVDTPLPDHALLRELLAHAQIGYRAGVQSKLDEIATLDNLLDVDTLAAFRQLADRMQFEQLATSLERNLS